MATELHLRAICSGRPLLYCQTFSICPEPVFPTFSTSRSGLEEQPCGLGIRGTKWDRRIGELWETGVEGAELYHPGG